MVRMRRQIDAIERDYEALLGPGQFASMREALRVVAYAGRGEPAEASRGGAQAA
jgi:hypothetical protein